MPILNYPTADSRSMKNLCNKWVCINLKMSMQLKLEYLKNMTKTTRLKFSNLENVLTATKVSMEMRRTIM